MAGLKLKKIIETFNLEVVNAGTDMESELLTIPEVNRPGLQFQNFYDYLIHSGCRSSARQKLCIWRV